MICFLSPVDTEKHNNMRYYSQIVWIAHYHDQFMHLHLLMNVAFQGRKKSVMKHTSSTRRPRTKRVASIVGLSIFFLLMALTMNVNGLSKLAYATALKPVTTQAPTPTPPTPTPTSPTPTPTPFSSPIITSPPNHSLYTLPTQISITTTIPVNNAGATIRVEFYST